MAQRDDIPMGRDNAISRAELARIGHCSDRDARATIADFRAVDAGDVILSSSSGKGGYWRSVDADEISGFVRETVARGRNVFLSVGAAKRFLKRAGRQHETLFDALDDAM